MRNLSLLRATWADFNIHLMFCYFDRKQWAAQFPTRNLIILSTNPLLVYPTHYTGEDGHISDTEDSKLVQDISAFADLENREEL